MCKLAVAFSLFSESMTPAECSVSKLTLGCSSGSIRFLLVPLPKVQQPVPEHGAAETLQASPAPQAYRRLPFTHLGTYIHV